MTFLRVDLDFDALAALVQDAIAYIDSEARIVAWTDRCANVTGISSTQCLGKRLDELFLKVDPSLEFAVLPQTLKLWTRDESRRSLSVTVLSISDGWLLSFGREQQFSQIDHLRSEIVAAVSHELKTPIATIKAFATTLRANPVFPDHARDEYLKTIEREADRLTFAVDDLLIAGRVDVEHLPERRENLSLDRIVELALERLDYSARHRLQYRAGSATVCVDPNLFGSALAHVIENALKFSADSASVEIEATQIAGATVIRVIDNGIGIADEHMPYIFDRFYRGDSRLTAANGGSGLGLYIARSVVRAHGGTIDIASAQGAGTTVTLCVPVRA
ncbi:MAG: HAMP domain-containing histidine kinase [Candidatus Eremiobacteraeota bacterium]|nr:HAMP domain-containing histidine kinase [Candidatus Eremiobacteraeota bacterium]